MSEDLCVNENFFIFFFQFFYGFYIIAFCIGTFVGYILSSPMFPFSLPNNSLKWTLAGGELIQTFLFTFLSYIFCYFFHNYLFLRISHNNSVDIIKKSSKVLLEQGKKSSDCCLFEENESSQLDFTVRNPCVNGTCKIKQRKIVCHG